jgi:MoxR-like ATPase
MTRTLTTTTTLQPSNHTHTNKYSAALSSALLAGVGALTLAAPPPASARNAEAAAQAAAARKAALKAAIANAKASGRDAGEPEAFQSAASVPEDHSPNSHSHQDEGARTTGGG